MGHGFARLAALGTSLIVWTSAASAQTGAPPAPHGAAVSCVPGERSACVCDDDSTGVRTCLPTGMGTGGCVCDDAPRAAPGTLWYGWQMLIIDTAGLALVLGAFSGEEALLWTGAGVQLVGGPVVHWAHGQLGRGFASLGLRVALPALGALAGVGQLDLYGPFVGGAIGMLIAWVIDDLAIARIPAPAAAARPNGLRVTSLGVIPVADRVGLGVGLSF